MMLQFTITNRSKSITRNLKYAILIGCGFWLAWTGFLWWQADQKSPSAIAVLGGGIRREMLAARLAQSYPNLPIVVSSGSPLPCIYRVFVKERGVAWQRVKVDFRAVDTLTNFTTLLPYLQSNQPRKVFMITSEGNLLRASVLAWLIWGSRGIAIQPVTVEGAGHHESWLKTFADGIRAIAWVLLGKISVAKLYPSNTPSDLELQSQLNLRQARCETGSATLLEHIHNDTMWLRQR